MKKLALENIKLNIIVPLSSFKAQPLLKLLQIIWFLWYNEL
jgi:hypothetical protein